MSHEFAESQADIEAFLSEYYRDDLGELARKYPKEQRSLTIEYDDVFTYDRELADDLLAKPNRVREVFEAAVSQYDLPIDVDLSGARVRFKGITGWKKSLEELRYEDAESLRTITGQISKATAVRPVVKVAAWECERCGYVSRIPQTEDGDLVQPADCGGCHRKGPFRLVFSQSTVEDHQLLRIKQPPEKATTSSQIGADIDAHVTGDLAGSIDAGERAELTGVIRVTPRDDSPVLDFNYDCWAVESQNDDYSQLDTSEHRDDIEAVIEHENPFEVVAASLSPGITGGPDVDVKTPWGETHRKYWWIRLGVAVANLFGSWRRPNGDGTYQRGSSHTLLMGDPSTGKSTIMGSVAAISPRSAQESGKNATGPGLTAAAVKDDFGDNQWSLEAGALVKAHRGVACVDEIDKMQAGTLDRLHSALEKERLEINKAGIDTTLSCETSMLAAGNPENTRFSDYESAQSQIDIVGSLMDRFDLIFTLRDKPHEDKDREVARSAIMQRSESALMAHDELDAEDKSAARPRLGLDALRSWVAIAKQEYKPVIRDEDVMELLEGFYVGVRQANSSDETDGDDAPVPATVRTLDGLLRLSEASARLRLSDTVDMIDARVAIALMQVSLNDIGYDPETGMLDADFASGRDSWSQRDRIRKLKAIIKNENEGGGARYDDVMAVALEFGMDDHKIRYDLDKLRKEGDVYEPGDGRLAVVD